MKMRNKQINKDRVQGSVNLECCFEENPVMPFGRDLFVSEEYDRVFCKRRLLPEHALMLAVLDQAVADFRKYLVDHDAKGKRRFGAAQEWIVKDDPNWIFSFVNICAVLGFAPDYLRQGLLGRKGKNPVEELQPPIGTRRRTNGGRFLVAA